eukprot:scaffold8.g1593.t1
MGGRGHVAAALVVACAALKLLLVPAYRSTDFEVHRNWLAITASLSLREWYWDATSEWTLDYPPFFAWFEWLLAQAAHLFDPNMLRVQAEAYSSPATVLFQRLTVIATEAVLLVAAWFATRRALPSVFLGMAESPVTLDRPSPPATAVMCPLSHRRRTHGQRLAALFLVAAHPGLLMVDHIHFQYNGLLLGIFLLSITAVSEGHDLAVVVGISLGPFVLTGQGSQLLLADKALAMLARLLGAPLNLPAASMTGGLVGTAQFAVLPQIGSAATAAATLAAMLPCLVAVWRRPAPEAFPAAVLYTTTCSFMLGYHVHEKAVLMVILPAAAMAVGSCAAAADFLFLSTLGTYSLFPLLFRPEEYAIKARKGGLLQVLLLLTYTLVASVWLSRLLAPRNRRGSLLSRWERTYLWGLAALDLVAIVLHPSLFGLARLPFLPLMATSFLGMVKYWLSLAQTAIGSDQLNERGAEK